MRIKKRTIWKVLGVFSALFLLAGITVIFVLQSPWFYEKVRLLIIGTVETATGGRVEVKSFRFDWKQMRAECAGLCAARDGTAGEAAAARRKCRWWGIKLVSILRQDVDIQSLTVSDPHVYLSIGADGRTNLPEPKVKHTGQSSTVEDILKLAIDRFQLERGIFEVEARTRIPFALRGENLNVHLTYDLLAPRYRGTIAIQPLYA